jgi:hypothetical protein
MAIEAKQIGRFFKKIPQRLAEKSFAVSIVFILTALLIGGALFYQYNYLPYQNSFAPAEVSLKLQQELYLSVLAEWQERQQKLDSADFKNWPDPFFVSGLTKPAK